MEKCGMSTIFGNGELKGVKIIKTYQLYNVKGTLLQSEKISNSKTNIAMAHLAPAVYFVKVIESNRDLKSFKIIKN